MRMIKKAAEVLNDADDFERKLAVILFQQEVAYIWDGTHEWLPGDPIFKRPNRWFDDGQQHIRPMIEEFEDGEAVSGRRIRCKDCDTYWRGEEPCFSCGEIVPTTEVDVTQAGWTSHSLFGEDFEGEFDIVEFVRGEMRTLFNEDYGRSLQQILWGDDSGGLDMPEVQVRRGGIRFPRLDPPEHFDLPHGARVEWVNEPIRMRPLFNQEAHTNLPPDTVPLVWMNETFRPPPLNEQQRRFSQQMAIYNAISNPYEDWGDLLIPYAAHDVRLVGQLHERVDTEAWENANREWQSGHYSRWTTVDEANFWTERRVNGISIPYYADYREVEFVPTPPEITPQITRHMSTIATNSAYGSTPVTERRRDYRGSRG